MAKWPRDRDPEKGSGAFRGNPISVQETQMTSGVFRRWAKSLSVPPSCVPLMWPLDRNIIPITPVYPCEGLTNKNMVLPGAGH